MLTVGGRCLSLSLLRTCIWSALILFYFVRILGPFTWAADSYCSAKWPCLGNRETMICVGPSERWCNQTRLDFVGGWKDFRGSSIIFNKDLKSTLTSLWGTRTLASEYEHWRPRVAKARQLVYYVMILQGQASAQSEGHTEFREQTQSPDSLILPPFPHSLNNPEWVATSSGLSFPLLLMFVYFLPKIVGRFVVNFVDICWLFYLKLIRCLIFSCPWCLGKPGC